MPKLFRLISLYEWINAYEYIMKWKKCHLLSLNIDEPVLASLQMMNENGLNCLAMLNQNKTLFQGYITQADIMRYLVDSYNGDTGFFEKPI